MDHWFDSLTKSLASREPSRRTVIAGIGATFAAAGGRWTPAFAAGLARPGPVKVTAKNATFGPCTVYSKGAHYEHHLTSRASASGHSAVLQKSRTIDPKTGTTLDTTVLVDGKKQIELTSTFKKSSQSDRLVIGDAFGVSGAVLTSTDGGKTVRGTVGGKTIRPYNTGSGKKLEFVNGQPKKTKPTPGVKDAITAVSKQADADYKRCTSSAHASLPLDEHVALEPYRARHDAHLQKLQETGCGTPPFSNSYIVPGTTLTCAQFTEIVTAGYKNSVQQSMASTNTFFSGVCEGCQNNCGGSLFGAIVDAVECIGSVAEYCANGCSACGNFFNYGGKQFACQQGCGHYCDPVPCGTGLGTSCNPGQVCIYQGNYEETFGYNTIPGLCCPDAHPQGCGMLGGFVLGYSYDYCCNGQNPCLYDTRFGAKVGSNYYGYYCCPSPRICGRRENGIWVGECCAYGQTCCGSTCCSPGQVCTNQAAVHLAIKGHPNHLTTPGGAKVCCPANGVRGSQCCQTGNWCGDECCGATPFFGCVNGKCPPQPTMCLTGVHCGFTCCQDAGCADPNTSTCKKTKCTHNTHECLTYPEMGVTSVCCPKGVTCAGGKCCPKGTKACQHLTTGTIGCYPASQCQPPLPPPQ
jgi:hypothetical protein